MPKTSIASSLRRHQSLDFLDNDSDYIHPDIINMGRILFPVQRDKEKPTRLGSLEIDLEMNASDHSKSGSKQRNGFFAVYKRNSKNKTSVLGSFSTERYMVEDLEKLVANVLEQRRFFSFPRRELIPELMPGYGFKRGLALSGLAALAVAIDFGLAAYSNSLGVPHQSYTSEVFENMVGFYGQQQAVINSAAGVLMVPSLVSGLFESFYRRAARAADRIRVRHIQKQSDEYGFLYGKDAENAIVKRYLEKKRADFHREVVGYSNISRVDSDDSYNHLLMGDDEWINTHLSADGKSPAELGREVRLAFDKTAPHYENHTIYLLNKPQSS